MLDHLKIMKEIARALPDVYKELSEEFVRSNELFSWIREHPEILAALKEGPHAVPLWEGPLDEHILVSSQQRPYAVVSTDGSQIYPDRHQGVPCFVLNSGTAQFIYGVDSAQAKLESVPLIVTQQEDALLSDDLVNCRRAELEFEVGLAASKDLMKDHAGIPFVFLCDGSLIFWHLESKGAAIKDRFLKRYIDLLGEFYEAQVPIAGYISLPKSKELVALLKNALVRRLGPSGEADTLVSTVDTDLVADFLKPSERTTIFTHNSPLAKEYPFHLVPCFTYLHVGDEIARVEMPRWVAQDTVLVERVMAIISDQSIKGNGYPVALSEAHEQAVIKNPDREFFFSLLRKMNSAQTGIISYSQKSLRKRHVSV
jgi:hypothetical protein